MKWGMEMQPSFCGWYFKMQSEGHSLALIPAVHRTKSESSASLQILWNEQSTVIPIPAAQAAISWAGPRAILGDNLFCPHGISLSVESKDWNIQGTLRFGPLHPLKIPIMGPFELMPFMECGHRIASMRHRVDGTLLVNGECVRFENAEGYIEGDRGHSFPREYAWSQCIFSEGSLMLAAARVPVGPSAFSGVIALVQNRGREYRFASYLGARLVSARAGRVEIRQGSLVLTAERLGQAGQPLNAPVCGAMTRTIHENLCCPVRYQLRRDGLILWELETDRASFEMEYPQ